MSTAETQLTAPVEVETADGGVPSVDEIRTLPVWIHAISELLEEAERAWQCPRLELPGGVYDAWMIVANGIPFRCVVMWLEAPSDGTKPRYIGRVDVRLRFA